MQIIVKGWSKEEDGDIKAVLLFHDNGEGALSLYYRGFTLSCPMDGLWSLFSFVLNITKEMAMEVEKK